MNYGELKTLVAEYSHRSDLAAQIPGFIAQGEALITSRVESRYMEKSETVQEADRSNPGSVVYTLPDDFLSMRSFALVGEPSNQRRVEMRSLGFVESTFISHLPTEQGTPEGYFIVGAETTSDRKILVYPAPVFDAKFSADYYAIPAKLVDDADTTRLLGSQADLYLYSALRYLAIFVQDVEMYQLYDQLFTDIAASDNEQTRRYHNEGAAQMQGASTWV